MSNISLDMSNPTKIWEQSVNSSPERPEPHPKSRIKLFSVYKFSNSFALYDIYDYIVIILVFYEYFYASSWL